MLGKIVGAGSSRPLMQLSENGGIVNKWLTKIPEKYDMVVIENYVIMPNHIHIVLSVAESGRENPAPTIGSIVGYFKYQTTKEIDAPGFWQRSYHDHIIRNEVDYLRIWEYVDENPARWAEDRYFVEVAGKQEVCI